MLTYDSRGSRIRTRSSIKSKLPLFIVSIKQPHTETCLGRTQPWSNKPGWAVRLPGRAAARSAGTPLTAWPLWKRLRLCMKWSRFYCAGAIPTDKVPVSKWIVSLHWFFWTTLIFVFPPFTSPEIFCFQSLFNKWNKYPGNQRQTLQGTQLLLMVRGWRWNGSSWQSTAQWKPPCLKSLIFILTKIRPGLN